MTSNTQNCGKTRADWEKRLLICVYVTLKLIEPVEISHAPESLLHSVMHVISISDVTPVTFYGIKSSHYRYKSKCYKKCIFCVFGQYLLMQWESDFLK